jgi:hypothetical protein
MLPAGRQYSQQNSWTEPTTRNRCVNDIAEYDETIRDFLSFPGRAWDPQSKVVRGL